MTVGSGKNITDQVMKHIKEKILIGRWPLGSKIPSENELCQELGCSRTSVRSAIQKYNVLGVLETKKGSGTFVRSLDLFLPKQELYFDLFGNQRTKTDLESFNKWRQARSLIEPQIAFKVAQTASPELIAKLDQINKEQFELIGNQDLFIKKDVEFHLTIASALENEIVDNIMQLLFSMPALLVFGNEEFGYSGGGYFHMMITDAIRQHDAERARDLMFEHQAEFSRIDQAGRKNT